MEHTQRKKFDIAERESLLVGGAFFGRTKKCLKTRTGVIVGVSVTVTTIALIIFLIVIRAGKKGYDNLPTDPYQRALALLTLYPLIDGHNDLPYRYRQDYNDAVWNVSCDLSQNCPDFHTDIPRARAGGLGAQFWSVYTACSTQYKDSTRQTMEQIDNVYKLIQRYNATFQLALTADDIQAAFNAGKIASLIGIEGGHTIDSSLGALRMFYKLGARYMTMTHSCNTPWADSCSVPPQHNGLTPFGETVVREMNRLGMLVDLSHVSVTAMHAILNITQSPVYYSHSSAYALCNASRNVPDDVLVRVAANGGVVSVNFYSGFIVCTDSPPGNISDVANHIDHMVNVMGVEHVGIGADYDGVSTLPYGLEDVTGYPRLFAELYRRGYSDSDVIAIAGGNTLRVLRANEAVARALSASVPYESVIFPNVSCRSNF